MKTYLNKITGRNLSPRRGLICALSIGLSGFAMHAPVSAADTARKFSERAGAAVNSAVIFANSDEHQKAIDALKVELAGNDLNPYEFATVYQMLGQYSYELDRSVEAQQYFVSAIDSGGLLPKETENLKVVIAQLMIGNGQYSEGAARLENFLNSGGESKSQYIDLLVNAWVQAEDYPRALPWAQKWFETANPKARKHYDLLNFLYGELDMTQEQSALRKEMDERWPEDNRSPNLGNQRLNDSGK